MKRRRNNRLIALMLTMILLMILASCKLETDFAPNGVTPSTKEEPSDNQNTENPPDSSADEEVDYNFKMYVGEELIDITKLPQQFKSDNSNDDKLMIYSISVTDFSSLELFINYRKPVIVKINVTDYGIQNEKNTFTKCKVEEIYFGNEAGIVEIGSEVTVQTPYYVEEENGEKCFWAEGSFRFLRKGESYVACLVPQEDGLNFSPIVNGYFELSDLAERQSIRELFPVCGWEIDEIRDNLIEQYVMSVNYNTKIFEGLFPVNIAKLPQRSNPENPLVDRAFVTDFTILEAFIDLSNPVIVKMKANNHGVQLEKETFTTCIIEEIYSGNENNTVAVGSKVVVGTPYYIDYVDGEKCFFADSEYRFLRKGQSYVACIYPNEDGSKFSLLPNGYFELSEPDARQALFELLPYCGEENAEIRAKFFEKYVTVK